MLSHIQSSLLKIDRQNLGNGCDIQIELILDRVETKRCIKCRVILSFYKSIVRTVHTPVKGSMAEPFQVLQTWSLCLKVVHELEAAA